MSAKLSARAVLDRSMRGNKFGAKRTWSELCQREFASKAEATRGEELALLERAGAIYDLEYQPRWVLCERPRITYTADFAYVQKISPSSVVEDVKGVLARDTRTKLAWLRREHGVTVTLLRLTRDGFEAVQWQGREPKRKKGRES